MIDIENIVINKVSNALQENLGDKYPTLFVTSEFVETPAEFPCVFIVQEDSSTLQRTQDESLKEHHATLLYSVNVYANNAGTKKEVAKEIANIVDATMNEMKFTRISCMQTPNIDRSVFRMSMRYRAIVGEDYRNKDGNKLYQMYRRG